jgi:hypothetical protein
MNGNKEIYKAIIYTKNGTQKKRYFNYIINAIKFCVEYTDEGRKYIPDPDFFNFSINLQ